MLSRITINNLVIVRTLDLAFGTGMSALTGETGAGKSILIDALGLALGSKADAGMIRSGEAKADVTANFDLRACPAALDWLAQHDLDNGDECLLRRVLVQEGRSRAYINGTPATQVLLRELGDLLVDIHGQHAHQTLLRTAAQRQLLDGFAGLEDTVHNLAARYKHWREASAAHEALLQAGRDRSSRLDYLQFQITELHDAVDDDDSLESLEAEHARLAHAEHLLAGSGKALQLLGDDEPGVRQALSSAHQLLTELAELDPTLAELCELLDTAGIQVDEATSTLRHYQDSVELDPQRLQAVDARLGRLHDLARKHGVEPAALTDLLAELEAEAETLQDADNRIEQLATAAQAAEAAYRSASLALRKARKKAAKQLALTVTDSMQTLGMKGGRFDVTVAPADAPAAHGQDRIRFLVAANPGQNEGELSAVASGGELSRISLAIQVAAADFASVPTLIFDEVDVGIGGAVAEVVGKLLRRLGRQRQILCVTHLAQVASQADQQLRVRKQSDGKSTETHIEALDADARIDEVARMMGGVAITDQTRKHADEMIQRALESR